LVSRRTQAKTIRIITVLKKVAKSELTSSTPIFAKMAVSAANTAESSAQNYHDASGLVIVFLPGSKIYHHYGNRDGLSLYFSFQVNSSQMV
jgi:hypothetical protein